MKAYLVSFATPEFYKSQKLLSKTALKHDIDEVIPYTKERIINTDFYRKNKNILDHKRGAGYWLWKPYIILETLSNVNSDDIVMYSDAGNEVIGNLRPLLEICRREEILLFQVHGQKNKCWTKRDCFVALDCDSERSYEAEQVCGCYQLYLCSPRSKKFVSGWLDCCQKENLVTDSSNELGKENLSEFKDHRHDQSILSILAIKWGLKVYRDPSQYGESYLFDNRFTESVYPTLFNLHRRRDKNLGQILFEKLKATYQI